MDDFRLSVLVHTGYCLKNRRLGENMTAENLRQEKQLLKVYKGKIDSLGEDDVLVVVSPLQRSQHDRLVEEYDRVVGEGDRKAAADLLKGNIWYSMVRYAQKRMGGRCLIFPNLGFLSPDTDEPRGNTRLGDIDESLRDKGFNVSEDTRVEVWGTSLSAQTTSCVVNVAQRLKRFWGLRRFPEIPVDATNRFEIERGELEVLANDLKNRIPESEGSLRLRQR